MEFVYDHDHLVSSFNSLIQHGYSPLQCMMELSEKLDVVFENAYTCDVDSTYTIPINFEIYGSSRLGIADAKVKGISS